MTYSAVDDVAEAYRATRALLLPFDLRRWLVLAVVVFFVSGSTSLDPHTNVGFLDVPGQPLPGPEPALLDLGVPALVLLAGLFLVVGVVVAFVAAVMEFVFVRVAQRLDVAVRPYFRPNLSNGLSLLLLRLLIGLTVLASVLFGVLLAGTGGVAFLLVVALLSPVIVLGVLLLYLVHRFTVDFVVPIMLVADVGIVDGWRRLLREFRSSPREYAVYTLVRMGLGLAAAIVAGVGFSMVAIVVGIPFVVLGGGAYLVGTLAGGGTALWAALWAVAVLYGIAVAVVGVTVVQVPISSYLRYYSLLVLADVSPAYDLVFGVRSYLDDVGDVAAVAGVDDRGDGDDGAPPALEESGREAGAGSDRPDDEPGTDRRD